MSEYVPEESGEKSRLIVHFGTWSDLSSTDIVAKLKKSTRDPVVYTGVGTTSSGHPGNRQIDYDFFNESPGVADMLMVGPGTIGGLGVMANAEDAFEQIRMDLESGKFRKFTFVGWSRGAKTSIDLQSMIDKLAEKGPLAKHPNGSFIRRQDVQFNAFLIDPVSMNPRSYFSDSVILPGFDEAAIVYAGAENRMMFPPFVPKGVSPYTSTLSVIEPWADHRGVVDPMKSTGKLIEEVMMEQLRQWGVDVDHTLNTDKMLEYALESIDERVKPKSTRLKTLGGYNEIDVLPSPIDDRFLEMFLQRFPAMASMLFGKTGSGLLVPRLKTELEMPLARKFVDKVLFPIIKKMPQKGSDMDPIRFSVPERKVVKHRLPSGGNIARKQKTGTIVRGALNVIKKFL